MGHRPEEGVAPFGGSGVEIGNRHHQGREHHPAGQRRDDDGAEDGARHLERRADGLLGGMCRGVEAGDRVGGEEEAESERPARAVRRWPDRCPGRYAGEVSDLDQSTGIERWGEGEEGDGQPGGDDENEPAAGVGDPRRRADTGVVEGGLHEGEESHGDERAKEGGEAV